MHSLSTIVSSSQVNNSQPIAAAAKVCVLTRALFERDSVQTRALLEAITGEVSASSSDVWLSCHDLWVEMDGAISFKTKLDGT
jgi:hypothetical protein